MNKDERIKLTFDRLNSKYNRIWEQLTNITLFTLASIVAYLISFLGYKNEPYYIIIFTRVTYILLTMFAFITFGAGMLITHLVNCGKKVHFISKQYGIE